MGNDAIRKILEDEKNPEVFAQQIINANPYLIYDESKFFYLYNEKKGYYELLDPKNEDGIRELIHNELVSWRRLDKARKNFENEIINCLKYNRTIRAEKMNPNENLVGLMNGVFDLDTGELLEHDPKYLITMVLDIEYDKEADCPVFKQFLDQTFAGNTDYIENTIMLGGYLISSIPLKKVNKMFIFVGAGANGKSILMEEVFAKMFHTKQITRLSLQDLASKSSDTIRAGLVTSMVNLSTEEEGSLIRNVSELKKITSGEGITVNMKYGPALTIIPKFIVLMATNHVPKFTDASHGLFRRLCLFPFNNTYLNTADYNRELDMFGGDEEQMAKNKRYRQDPDLEAKLHKELPGILNLFYQGYLRLKERNYIFIETEDMRQEALTAVRNNDPEYNFILEECEWVTQELRYTDRNTLYEHYRNWYKVNWAEYGKSASINKFFQRLEHLFPVKLLKKRIRSGNSNLYHYNLKISDADSKETSKVIHTDEGTSFLDEDGNQHDFPF